jgi:hypothetical protein
VSEPRQLLPLLLAAARITVRQLPLGIARGSSRKESELDEGAIEKGCSTMKGGGAGLSVVSNKLPAAIKSGGHGESPHKR